MNLSLKVFDYIFKKLDILLLFIDWIFWIFIKCSCFKLKIFIIRFYFKGNGKKVLVFIIKRVGI